MKSIQKFNIVKKFFHVYARDLILKKSNDFSEKENKCPGKASDTGAEGVIKILESDGNSQIFERMTGRMLANISVGTFFVLAEKLSGFFFIAVNLPVTGKL